MLKDPQTVIFSYDINYFAHVLTRCCHPGSIEKLAGALIDAHSTLACKVFTARSADSPATTFAKNPGVPISLQFKGIKNRDWL